MLYEMVVGMVRAAACVWSMLFGVAVSQSVADACPFCVSHLSTLPTPASCTI